MIKQIESPKLVKNGNVKTICRFCLARCPLTVRIKNGKIVNVRPDENIFCEKGYAIGEIVHAPDRLQQPMARKDNDWRPVSWQEALDTTALKIKSIIQNYGSQAIHIHLGQSQVMNLLSKEYAVKFCNAINTSNLSSSGSQCSVCRNMGNQYTYGYSPFPDFSHSRCIVVWGANPENTNAFNLRSIKNSVKNGSKLIVVDPRRTALAKISDCHLQLNPGTDQILAMGIISVLIKEGLVDSEFVQNWTYGFDKLSDSIEDLRLELVESITGINRDLIQETAKLYFTRRPSSVLTGNSLEHHIDGFQTVRAVAIMQAITGNLEVPGGSVINESATRRKRIDRNKNDPGFVRPIGSNRFPLFYQATGEAQANVLSDAVLYNKPYPVSLLLPISPDKFIVEILS